MKRSEVVQRSRRSQAQSTSASVAMGSTPAKFFSADVLLLALGRAAWLLLFFLVHWMNWARRADPNCLGLKILLERMLAQKSAACW